MNNTANLARYFDLEVLKMLIGYYSDKYQIAMSIVDLEENILIAHNWLEICTKFHRVSPETMQLCIESNRYITENLATEQFIEHKCHNGLIDIAMPIKSEGLHIATFYIGQFFFEGEETNLDFYINRANKFGFNEKEYSDAFRKIPSFSHEHIYSLLNTLNEEFIKILIK